VPSADLGYVEHEPQLTAERINDHGAMTPGRIMLKAHQRAALLTGPVTNSSRIMCRSVLSIVIDSPKIACVNSASDLRSGWVATAAIACILAIAEDERRSTPQALFRPDGALPSGRAGLPFVARGACDGSPMHAQTENAQIHRDRPGSRLSTAAGLALYFLTLTGEAMLGASSRWLLTYLGAATVGAFVPLGLSAEGLAWVVALVPIAWSLIGLALPGRGLMWGRRLGARRPSATEAEALANAIALLRSADPALPDPAVWLVLDDPLPGAAVRGTTVVLSRGLLDSESLAAVLAHELGHADSLDGRLTEALNRLALWDDPLGPVRPERGVEGGVESYEEPPGGLLWGLLRWALRLAGGSFAQRLLSPLWSAYWRTREYAADAYAASLGQAEDLARHLTDFEQPFDAPRPGLIFKAAAHPPVALRIERLHEYSMRGGSK
jgi:Zn-dependent protease with chaperone function